MACCSSADRKRWMEQCLRTAASCCFDFEPAVVDSRRRMKTCNWDFPSCQTHHLVAAYQSRGSQKIERLVRLYSFHVAECCTSCYRSSGMKAHCMTQSRVARQRLPQFGRSMAAVDLPGSLLDRSNCCTGRIQEPLRQFLVLQLVAS